MTATLMCRSESENPTTTAVTFILAGRRLITVRYDEPRPFHLVANKLARACSPVLSGEAVLMELLDAIVDRSPIFSNASARRSTGCRRRSSSRREHPSAPAPIAIF